MTELKQGETMRLTIMTALLAVALTACDDAERTTPEQAVRTDAAGVPPTDATVAATKERAPAPLDPPGPGEPGGLPDDRAAVSEGPFAGDSAQGAANVVQTYFAFAEAGRLTDAWRLRRDEAISEAEFIDRARRYREYHAQVGAPGRIEGAAGSLYVEVPVQIYGRLGDGTAFNRWGSLTLRRPNGVPGGEPLGWRIVGSKPADLLH